jgi:cytochrome c
MSHRFQSKFAGLAVAAGLSLASVAFAPAAHAQAPAAAAAPSADSLEQRLASADAGRGKTSALACKACHTLNEGGRPLIGPNLWGVVGRPKGTQENFKYSEAMKTKGGNWTLAELDQFITAPKAFVPGTIMPFAGIQDPAERADVLVFLNSLSKDPAPLPKASAESGGGPKAQ